MLADFYIPKLSNNIKIAVQQNNLVGQIWYRSLDRNTGNLFVGYVKIHTFDVMFSIHLYKKFQFCLVMKIS